MFTETLKFLFFISYSEKDHPKSPFTFQNSKQPFPYSLPFTPPLSFLLLKSSLHLLPSYPTHSLPYPDSLPLSMAESREVGVFWFFPHPFLFPVCESVGGGQLSCWLIVLWPGSICLLHDFCQKKMEHSRFLASLILAALLSQGKASPGGWKHLGEGT